MKRLALCLFAVLVLCLCGCAALLETSGYEKGPYQEPTPAVEAMDNSKVENYGQLVAAISGVIAEHREEATILFQNYQGDISIDLETACREIQYDDAMGNFAVESFSYDVRRIVSYYEAELTTLYRRTKEQVTGVVSLSGTRAIREGLARALKQGRDYLAIYIPATTLTEEQLQELLRDAYFQYADGALCLPAAEVSVYPEGESVERVFELCLNYGLGREEQEEYMAALEAAIENSLAQAVRDGGSLVQLVSQLSDTVSFGASDTWSSTAYGALVEGQADSQGLAMAFAAVCRAGGLEAQVVEGSYYGETRYWNLVSIGEGRWGHCDVAALRSGSAGPFLAGDQVLAGSYVWDTERYPVAEGLGDSELPDLKLPEVTE